MVVFHLVIVMASYPWFYRTMEDFDYTPRGTTGMSSSLQLNLMLGIMALPYS